MADEQPKVSRNLLIAATSSVQFVASRADERGQLLFDKVMNIFCFVVVEKGWIRNGATSNFREGFKDFRKLFRRQHSRVFQSVGMGAAGGEFEGQQPLIVRKRPLPFFKFGIKRLPESAGLHIFIA